MTCCGKLPENTYFASAHELIPRNEMKTDLKIKWNEPEISLNIKKTKNQTIKGKLAPNMNIKT